jgi:hypothetical protein
LVTTFVLIPGADGSAGYWSLVAPRLERAGHGAIALDLPADDPQAGLESRPTSSSLRSTATTTLPS